MSVVPPTQHQPEHFISPSMVMAGLALLLMLPGAWQLAAIKDEQASIWLMLSAVFIIPAFIAMGWLRPVRTGLTAPQVMLLLGAAGMMAGLAFDARNGGLIGLATMCLGGSHGLMDTLWLHAQQLPLMHLGMVGGGLVTVPLLRHLRAGCKRQFCAWLVQNLACSVWMVLGMGIGTLVFLELAHWVGASSFAAMFGGMFAGMVWGMAAGVALYRLWFLLLPYLENLRGVKHG